MRLPRNGGPPPFTLASDTDGVRFIIIDPADADMSEWTLEQRDSQGRPSLSQFEQATWFSDGEGDWNGLGYGTPKKVWCAVADHRGRIGAWIGPDGARHDP